MFKEFSLKKKINLLTHIVPPFSLNVKDIFTCDVVKWWLLYSSHTYTAGFLNTMTRRNVYSLLNFTLLDSALCSNALTIPSCLTSTADLMSIPWYGDQVTKKPRVSPLEMPQGITPITQHSQRGDTQSLRACTWDFCGEHSAKAFLKLRTTTIFVPL